MLQICNGLGAGNIGDEFMARAFWASLPPELSLEVEVLPNHELLREPYPSRHSYRRVEWDGSPALEPASPGFLVGDTPVTEALGVEWPLRFLAPRLQAFHSAGLPVDALGVGVEPLRSDEAIALFRRHYLPIRSWSVRSLRCRELLVQLGVPEHRLVVGADWAWLYRPGADLRDWGARTWRELGVDPCQPLLVANVVNEIWREASAVKQAIAAVLDAVAADGVQVAFFCQEMRPGEFYDRAAARETLALMRQRAVIVPNHYYSPDETLALLGHAAFTLAGRYHFVVASVLAGTVPVCISRSEKMDDLLEEMPVPRVGRIEAVSADALATAIGVARADASLRARLSEARLRLQARARANLALLKPAAGAAQG